MLKFITPRISEYVLFEKSHCQCNRVEIILQKNDSLILYAWHNVLIKREFEHRHTEGEYYVKIKTEIGVMLLQAKECRRLPAHYQKLREKHGTDSSSQSSGESNPVDTLISDVKLPEL